MAGIMKKLITIIGLLLTTNLLAENHQDITSADQVQCTLGGVHEHPSDHAKDFDFSVFEQCEKGNIIDLQLTFSRTRQAEMEIAEFVRTYCSFNHPIYSSAVWQRVSQHSVSCVYRGSPRKIKKVK